MIRVHQVEVGRAWKNTKQVGLYYINDKSGFSPYLVKIPTHL
jgi:uncharacterized protein (DUF736 family)